MQVVPKVAILAIRFSFQDWADDVEKEATENDFDNNRSNNRNRHRRNRR